MSDATDSSPSKFSAAPSMLGYLYQCRMALLQTLIRIKTNPDLVVRIETLDDVEFQKDGAPTEVVQVKHHLKSAADLTDASVDLWKTIRIWCDLYDKGVTKEGAVLYLMTTAKAANESAAYYLRADTQNIPEAIKKLRQVAITSSNKKNEQAYADFLKLDEENQEAMLKSAVVVDECPAGEDIIPKLQKEIWGACDREKLGQFLTYYEGWWFGRVIRSLTEAEFSQILGEELDVQLSSLREQFKNDNLPIDDHIKSEEKDPADFKDRVFVHQLNLIQISPKRIAIAVQNYYRAYTQRSQWAREELLVGGEIEAYENRLLEEWTIYFERMREELNEKSTEEEKVKLAKEIYKWVELEAHIPIRAQCQEKFITRGSYHMLADRSLIGWHPDFLQRLQALLKVTA